MSQYINIHEFRNVPLSKLLFRFHKTTFSELCTSLRDINRDRESSSSFPEETFIQVVGNNTFLILEFTPLSSIYSCEVTFPEINVKSLFKCLRQIYQVTYVNPPNIRLTEIIQADTSSANRALLFEIKEVRENVLPAPGESL